ncbi:uncharacterized protein LOC143425712 [Xylocopa sonorina]|uniref:uncharacterized protein LOC143425712 n=1 Tax=Xylocopa sonorina TaxID=1818115 RepID=UPI00403B1EFA
MYPSPLCIFYLSFQSSFSTQFSPSLSSFYLHLSRSSPSCSPSSTPSAPQRQQLPSYSLSVCGTTPWQGGGPARTTHQPYGMLSPWSSRFSRTPGSLLSPQPPLYVAYASTPRVHTFLRTKVSACRRCQPIPRNQSITGLRVSSCPVHRHLETSRCIRSLNVSSSFENAKTDDDHRQIGACFDFPAGNRSQAGMGILT